jgi:hypothetical protein
MPKDTRAAFLRELAKVEPELVRAFEEAVQTARNAVVLNILEEAIRRGDVEFAVQILARADYFKAPLDQAIVEAFNAGGAYQANLVPKRLPNTVPRLAARFDLLNDRGIEVARRLAGDLVTEITGDQSRMIRTVITEGLSDNRGYQRIARDLVGTKVGNTRLGGVVGLHSNQANAVISARRELEAGEYAKYLSRSGKLRNRNIDRTVAKAMKDGRALTQKEIDRSIRAYADGLLRYRGRTIARTEANKALNAGRRESVEQQIDSGLIREDLVTKVWQATLGRFTRDHHAALHGTSVKWREKFISPLTGFAMQGPHDPEAPAADVVNCRCILRIVIDYLAMADQRLAA